MLYPDKPLTKGLEIRYLNPGEYTGFLHCVDTKNQSIIGRYMLSISCSEPLITKTEKINCLAGKENVLSLRFSNPFSESKKFIFVSSEPTIMVIPVQEDVYEPKEEKEIQIKINCTGEKEPYIYVYDTSKTTVTSIRIIIKSK